MSHKKVRKKHLKVVILDVYAKWLAHRDKYTGTFENPNIEQVVEDSYLLARRPPPSVWIYREV